MLLLFGVAGFVLTLWFLWRIRRWNRKESSWSGAVVDARTLSSRLKKTVDYPSVARVNRRRTMYHEQLSISAREVIRRLNYFHSRRKSLS